MVISRTFGFFLLSLLISPPLSFAEKTYLKDWGFNAQETWRFEHGKVVNRVISKDNNVQVVSAFLKINVPVEKLFTMLVDYKTLPEYMPNLETIDVLEESNEGALVDYHLGLPLGFETRYRLKLTYNIQASESWVSWVLVPRPELNPKDTIKDSVGYFHLIQAENNQVTWLHYDTETNPGDIPFGFGWIVGFLSSRTVVSMLENTKERAERQWSSSEKE